MSRGPDAATLLERALIRTAQDVGLVLVIDSANWTRWASATFTGARHVLQVTAETSHALDAWVGGLSEHEFGLPGHVVADLSAVQQGRNGAKTQIAIEALTVESW